MQFGGNPGQKKLTEALLTDLCTEGKEVDKDKFSRLAGRLSSTSSEDDTGGVLVSVGTMAMLLCFCCVRVSWHAAAA